MALRVALAWLWALRRNGRRHSRACRHVQAEADVLKAANQLARDRINLHAAFLDSQDLLDGVRAGRPARDVFDLWGLSTARLRGER